MMRLRTVGPAVIWGRVIIALLIITVSWMMISSVTSTTFDAMNTSIRGNIDGTAGATFDIIRDARGLFIDGAAVAMSVAVIVWGLRKMAQRERVTEVIYA